MREIDGVLYCNDGDWVESCTALVEHLNGELSLWHTENMYGRREQETLVEIAGLRLQYSCQGCGVSPALIAGAL